VGVELAVVDAHLAHAALHQRQLVAGVADGEALGQLGGGVLLPQHPEAEAVKGGDEDVGAGRARQRHHPLAHLGRRLVGEGDAEDRLRIDPLHEEVGHAVGDDAGLAGAGAGQHQQRPLGGGDRLPLRRVERGEIQHRGGFCHPLPAQDKP